MLMLSSGVLGLWLKPIVKVSVRFRNRSRISVISSLNFQKCLYAIFGHFDNYYIFGKMKVKAI